MNQKQFLSTLENHLRKLPRDEVKEILRDYEEYFMIGIEEGKTEYDIAVALGSPKQLANELNTVYAIKQFEEQKNIENVFWVLLSIMGLSIVNCIIVIVGFFILLPFTLAYVIAVPVMLLSPFILLGLGFMNGFSTIVTVLAFLGYYMAKIGFKFFMNYLRWNMSIVKGKEAL